MLGISSLDIMVGGSFVYGHKAPEPITGHLCQWHPTQAKLSCTCGLAIQCLITYLSNTPPPV